MSKNGHYSIKSLQMTSKFELYLYLMMLYIAVKFEWNCCTPSNVIYRKPQLSQNLSQNFADDLQFQTWPVFNDTLPFCKVWMDFISYPSETNSVTTLTTPTPKLSLSVTMLFTGDTKTCIKQDASHVTNAPKGMV